MRAFGWNAVDFAAIAGGENERFFQDAAGAEFVGGAARLFGGERHTLAYLNGRGAVIQADEDDFHSCSIDPFLALWSAGGQRFNVFRP